MGVRVYSLSRIAPQALLHITHDELETATDYHSHEFFEIAYISKGVYTHNVNGKIHKLKRGDVIFLKIGDCHSYKADEPNCKITNVLFYPSLYENNLEAITEYSQKMDMHNIIHLDGKDIRQVESLIKYMEYEQDEQNEDYLEISKRYLDILLLIITRSAHKERPNRAKFDISPLLEYIQQNIKTLKPNNIADKVSYNSAYFSKLFKQTMGVNLVDYINRKRIDAAIELINNTDETFANIALMVGFNEVNYFYKLFKRYTGVTPQTLRDGKNKN